MNSAYWKERESAVKDGSMLGSDDAAALFDYLRDLELAVRMAFNDHQIHRWITIDKLLEAGPKEPE
jgi:hypothetical protein